jgi:dynein heavy chain, axonemal
MRGIKSVLVMAGNIKRSSPDLKEEIILIRAMRDSNIPKFIKEDLPLFNALVQDLFPGIQIEDSRNATLMDQLPKSI